MIPNFDDRERFAAVLHANVSPASPIQSQEHLYGREKQIRQIEQAFYAPGRTIFIHGDRGVGKTSLGQTIAYLHQPANREPVLVPCGPHSTFMSVMAAVIADLKGQKSAPGSTTLHSAKLGYKGIGLELGRTRHEAGKTESTQLDLGGVVAALVELGQGSDKNSVVVIDEFDRIKSDGERGYFADLIKQLGDQHVRVRFVFCGVAESMQTLLGAHESCYRYVEGVELPRLSWEGRFEIIQTAATALGVTVDDHPRYRISAISDGFPHYVHLICEKLFWQMFNDPAVCTVPNMHHYREAVAEAVMGIEQHLKTRYERAVLKDTSDYEDVLWSVADHPDLFRSTESIYNSYWHLFGGLDQPEGATILDRATVVSRLGTLKDASCGNILTNVPNRKGWYQFRESIMRGYVRLRAEEQDVELALDYAAASSASATPAYPIRGARRSRKGVTRMAWERTRTPSGLNSSGGR